MRLERTFERVLAREMAKVLTEAGFSISVFDGEEVTLSQSRSVDDILAAMFTTDEDIFRVFHKSGKQIGWVHFIYGNDGTDVIHDYSTNLEVYMEKINQMADRLDAGDFSITFKDEKS